MAGRLGQATTRTWSNKSNARARPVDSSRLVYSCHGSRGRTVLTNAPTRHVQRGRSRGRHASGGSGGSKAVGGGTASGRNGGTCHEASGTRARGLPGSLPALCRWTCRQYRPLTRAPYVVRRRVVWATQARTEAAMQSIAAWLLKVRRTRTSPLFAHALAHTLAPRSCHARAATTVGGTLVQTGASAAHARPEARGAAS